MKKFTSIIALLLCFVATASAQNDFAGAGLDPNNAYTIGGVRGHWYADANQFKSETDAGITFDAANEGFQFAFVPAPDDATKVYLYNVGQKKFVKKDRSLTTTSPDQIYVWSDTGDPTHPLFFSFTADKSNYNVNLGGSKQMAVDTWKTYDDGNKNGAELASGSYSLAEAQAILSNIIDVTYQVMFNGAVVKSVVVKQASGSPAQMPDALANDYLTFGDPSVATVSETDNTVTYEATSTLPFELSTDFNTAKWYTLNLRNSENKYVVNDGAAPYTLTTIDASDKGLWAFMGSPYALTVINKAAGPGKVLRGDAAPIMTEPKGTNADAWFVAKNDYGFTLHLNNSVVYLNDVQGKLNYWRNAAAATDQGSAFTAAELPENLYNLVVSNIKPYYDKAGDYFAITNEAKAQLDADGYEAALTNCDVATYNKLLADRDAGIYYPATGYYRIKNKLAGQDSYGYVGAESNLNGDFADATTASTVVKLTKNEDNTYAIQAQGGYFQKPTTSAQVALGTAPANFTPQIIEPGIVAWNGDTSAQYASLHTGKNQGYKVVGWASSSDASHWTVEDAATIDVPTHAVGELSYATLCVPFDATIEGSDVKAATLTLSADKKWATLNDVTGVIAAGTPVVLYGNAATVTLTIGENYAAEPATGTLAGTFLAKTWEADDLTLGASDGKAGFYKWAGTTLGANRAYIPAATANGAKGFAFDESTVTGINQAVVNTTQTDGPIYNLAGQRVSKAQKGVYIMNGKKVVVK